MVHIDTHLESMITSDRKADIDIETRVNAENYINGRLKKNVKRSEISSVEWSVDTNPDAWQNGYYFSLVLLCIY